MRRKEKNWRRVTLSLDNSTYLKLKQLVTAEGIGAENMTKYIELLINRQYASIYEPILGVEELQQKLEVLNQRTQAIEMEKQRIITQQKAIMKIAKERKQLKDKYEAENKALKAQFVAILATKIKEGKSTREIREMAQNQSIVLGNCTAEELVAQAIVEVKNDKTQAHMEILKNRE